MVTYSLKILANSINVQPVVNYYFLIVVILWCIKFLVALPNECE